ncbi:MAG TPA: O-antigen ligase family protein [Candidatus Angelobacter sp.]|nr:O-antigen ligase family protein [Candidatus Angelobacter sp.]
MNTGLGQFIPLVLYVVILFGCAASAFWKPRIGIYIILPLLPFETLREKLDDFPLGSHAIYLILVSVIAGLFFRSQLTIPKTPLNRVLLAFAVFLYISLWQGAFYLSSPLPLLLSDPRLAVWRDFMAMPLLFVATTGAIRTQSQIKFAVLVVCLSILIVDRSALMNVLSHSFSHFDENKRDGGPLGYAGSNGLAAFEAQCTCLLIGLAAYEKRRLRKIGLYLLIALTSYCLLYAFSRGGYLSLLTGLLVFGIFKDKKVILLVGVILLTWQFFVPQAVQERVMMTYNKDDKLEASADERVQLWTDSVQLITTNPVLGSGFATYMFMGRVRHFKDTHNMYVKVLVETGIVGMVFFLLILSKLFTIARRLFRAAKEPFNQGLALGLLTLMGCLVVVNLFGDRWTYIEINGITWVLFALGAQAYILESRNQEAVSENADESASQFDLQLAPVGQER